MRAAVATLPLLLLLSVFGELPAQELRKSPGDRLSSRRGLDHALQPSEAELHQRMTPVVRAVQATADSVVSVHLYAAGRLLGQGSGVIIEESGLALSNWHVVAPASADPRISVKVCMKDGTRIDARVLSTSPEHDLALLQMKPTEGLALKPVTMGDSKSLMIGETVIAIGNPKGHANTVTVGVLSAIDREIRVRSPDGIRGYKGLLQTDAAINQGNSGGALLDITGKLIGINNAMANDSENIGFAIPVNTVRKVFHEVLLSSDRLTSVYLGLRLTDQSGKIVLSEVTENSPAWRAGLRQGDQLLKVKNTSIRNKIDYARALLGTDPSSRVPLTVLRGGRQQVFQPQPISNSNWQVLQRIGLELEEVDRKGDAELIKDATLQLARELGYRPTRYLPSVLRVRHVRPDSPAARLRFAKGDVLLGFVDVERSIFGSQRRFLGVETVEQLADLLRGFVQRSRGQTAREVWVMRDGEIFDGTLRVNPN